MNSPVVAAPAASASEPIRTSTFALMVLALTITSASTMRAVFSPVQELAKINLGFSDLQISLVQGLAVSIPVVLFSLPIGRVIDSGNRKHLLVVMALAWSAGTLWTGFATGFYELFAARMLAGVGAMCAVPVAISMAADLSNPAGRGRALLSLSLGNMAGAAAAFALSGVVIASISSPVMASVGAMEPWRAVHVVFAVASFVLILPLFLIREPERREIGAQIHTALTPALREIWRRRRLIIPLFFGQVTVVMADTAAAIWAAPVLTRDYGLQPEDFAGWMGLVILLSGVFGSLIGGFAADAGQASCIRGGILLGAVVAALLSIPAAFFPIMPSTTGFALMLALFLACGAVTGLTTATAIAVLVPNEIRGVCLSMFMIVGGVVGFGLAPTLVTVISQLLGGEHLICYSLVTTTTATSFAAFIGFILAIQYLRKEDNSQSSS